MDRRLAAILVADVVGYSRRMGENEIATVRALRECRDIFFRSIEDHTGRVFNTAGDSVLAEFGSVLNAVTCAAAVQRLLAERNAGQLAEGRLEFRIGINQGEIVADGVDVYGEGINVAARLEALGRPGGIAISNRVHEDVAGKLDLAWTDGGEQALKNIARPVRVWHWTEAKENAASAVLPVAPDKPSLAVLPFADHGDQAGDTIFSDGITEDIITGLTRFRSLFVLARASSFAFRDKQIGPAEIGRELNVSYLLGGSVRRAGERIRVTAQLIEAASGAHVWAERFDRSLTDIFEVQDEIATTIVSTLVGRIDEAEFEQSLRKPTDSLAAYELLLHGVARFRAYGPDTNKDACALFEKAIACDPHYAVAHSYLGLALLALHGYGGAPRDVRTDACELAQRGVDLDPQHGGCRRMLGHVLLYDRNYDLAEYHARRAIELNPNDADGAISMGYLLVQRGKAAEGLDWIDKAIRLNPFHPPWYHAQRAAALYSLCRFEDSAQASRRLPEIGGWSFRLAAAYGQLGRKEEAAAEASAILKANPSFRIGDFMASTILLERDEDRELLRDGLAKAGLPE